MSSGKLDLQRFRDGDDPSKEAQVWVEAGQILFQQGNADEARSLLHAAVEVDPSYADAWRQLASLALDEQEQEPLLRRVLALKPGLVGSPAGTRLSKKQRWRWALGLLGLTVLLLLVMFVIWGSVDTSLAGLRVTPTPSVTPTPTLTPEQIAAQFVSQLQVALSDENWPRALEIVAILNGLAPANEEVQQWTLTTHMQYGQALVASGQMDSAQTQFELAAATAPDDAAAQRWLRTTQVYLTGQEAFEVGHWDVAIRFFARAYELMPDYDSVLDRLVDAYRHQGQAAIGHKDWDVAIEGLTQAYELAPDAPQIADLLSLAFRQQAQAAMEEERWTTAIETLEPAYEQLPGDPNVQDLLAVAYRQRGIVWEEKGKLQKARADLEAALALRPDDTQAQTHLDKVMYRLFPPKRIEVDISQQHFYAWQGDVLVYSFPTSTGLRGRDTATGHYQVLDKMPMAYSSVWRLKMPHWLGIYYVGNIENGIHALPIRPDGSVMWGGLLGQRASYGCVILSTEAARLIYNWADIGTPVDIHY